MAEMTAEQALKKARTQLKAAGQPGSTKEEQRALVETLITLPSYRDPTCTLLFSSLITRYFKEFEDLQDGTVDAVLDLCEDEDEATRITGIKGLGSTARADTRWVRGNAGVLLQLLECPERELKEVKIVLDALMDMSPKDVIEVMADDCKGSEEETGASRRNIIEYLSKDCGSFRRKFIESGAHSKIEDIFRTGFMDVLKTASSSESIMILEMLVPLPSISGTVAQKETTTGFIRALTDSLKGGSSLGRSTRHIQIFGSLAERLPSLEPKAALYFFSKHGAAVIQSMLIKGDPVSLSLIKKLRGWVQEAVKQWEKGTLMDSDKKVVRRCLEDMLEEIAAIFKEDEKEKDRRSFMDHSLNMEQSLLPLYELIRFYDVRLDGIPQRTMDGLDDLAGYALKAKNDTTSGSAESKRLRNLADMCDTINDPKKDFSVIVPSWTSAAPTAPTRPNIPNSSLIRPIPTSNAPSGPKSSFAPRHPAQTQSNASSSRPAPYPTTKPLTGAPVGPRHTPQPPSGPSSSRPHLNTSLSQNRGISISGTATAKASPVNGRPTAAAMNSRESAVDLTSDSTSTSRVLPLLTSKMSSRGKELLSQANTSSPEPTIPSNPTPLRGNELLEKSSGSHTSTTPSIPHPAPPSLLSRLSGVKRDRDDPPPPTPAPIPSRSSLASRLGGILPQAETEEPDGKRPKTMSILSARISKGTDSPQSPLPPRPSSSTLPSPPSSSQPLPPSLSIAGHSSSARTSLGLRIKPDPSPIDIKVQSSLPTSDGRSMKSFAGLAARKEPEIPKAPISIMGRAPQVKAEPVPYDYGTRKTKAEQDEEDKKNGVIRRGRGFTEGGGGEDKGNGRGSSEAPNRERNHSDPKAIQPRNHALLGIQDILAKSKATGFDRQKHHERKERA